MVNIQIPEELDVILQQAAERLGRSKDDLVREALEASLEEQFATEDNFTDEQIARMKHSIAQLDRGEVVTSEQVESFFEDWYKERSER